MPRRELPPGKVRVIVESRCYDCGEISGVSRHPRQFIPSGGIRPGEAVIDESTLVEFQTAQARAAWLAMTIEQAEKRW
jgi:hypothetical protein